MSSPKDYYKDIFGSVPNGSDKGSNDSIDLDELLRSIDREIGDVKPITDPHLLDYDLYNDIFGDNKDKDYKDYVVSSSGSKKSPPEKVTLTQETKAIPIVSHVSEARRNVPKTELNKSVAKSNEKRDNGNPQKGRDNREAKSDDGNPKKFRLTGARYIIFVLIVSFVLAYVSWVCVNDVFGLNKPEITATITIPQNYKMSQVASELKKAKIIEYPLLFRLFGVVAHADKKIDAGMYKLTSDLDYRAIVSQMQEGSSDTVVKITITEGTTLTEIFTLLENKGVCPAAKLMDTATNYNFSYKFLDSSTVGEEKRLEGYLFPDTYEFYMDEASTTVIKRFLDNFNAKVTDDMYSQANKLGYSMVDVIKIASLIEKESANDNESAKVASVIYNRLKSSSFPYLQIDATVQYVLPERKAKLTNTDISINNPYNSYKYKGLPPTAISNPGLDSIKAALYPDNTNYYFYALNKNGNHSFFTSSNDFDSFVSSSSYGG